MVRQLRQNHAPASSAAVLNPSPSPRHSLGRIWPARHARHNPIASAITTNGSNANAVYLVSKAKAVESPRPSSVHPLDGFSITRAAK